MIKKLDSGKWLLDLNLSRDTPRVRRVFYSKAEAVKAKREIEQRFISGQQLTVKKDTRKLSELIDLYQENHARFLKCQKRVGVLRKIARIDNPYAYQLDAAWYLKIRRARSDQVSANTLNHDRAYLVAMFNDLQRSGLWQGENPFAGVKKIKSPVAEMAFLDRLQVERLFQCLAESDSKHVYLVALICLSTGARWSEAETLTKEQLGNGLISFWNTKSGKPRHIPVSDDLYQILKSHKAHGINRLFGRCYNAFTLALVKSGLTLPEGQRTHVLRHTFASFFIQQGGSLLELKEILGHSTIQMTMRYSHLAKGHLESAKSLNPASAWSLCGHFTKSQQERQSKARKKKL